MSKEKSGFYGVVRTVAAVIAILFGILTLKSGGSVLLGNEDAVAAAGSYVPFVLWFNVCAGFFYIAAGIGFFLSRSWSTQLALLIAVSTLAVFAALGIHVANEGLYEARTVIAMTARSTIWTLLFVVSFKYLKFQPKEA